jgi:hypothetical protein
VNEVLFDVHIECIIIVESSGKLVKRIVYIEKYVDYLTDYAVTALGPLTCYLHK